MADRQRAKILSPGEVEVLLAEHLAPLPFGDPGCRGCAGGHPCVFVRLAQSHEAMREVATGALGDLDPLEDSIKYAKRRLSLVREGD